jgi:hypothetical protein
MGSPAIFVHTRTYLLHIVVHISQKNVTYDFKYVIKVTCVSPYIALSYDFIFLMQTNYVH